MSLRYVGFREMRMGNVGKMTSIVLTLPTSMLVDVWKIGSYDVLTIG